MPYRNAEQEFTVKMVSTFTILAIVLLAIPVATSVAVLISATSKRARASRQRLCSKGTHTDDAGITRNTEDAGTEWTNSIPDYHNKTCTVQTPTTAPDTSPTLQYSTSLQRAIGTKAITQERMAASFSPFLHGSTAIRRGSNRAYAEDASYACHASQDQKGQL